jgi:hypothetical protein
MLQRAKCMKKKKEAYLVAWRSLKQCTTWGTIYHDSTEANISSTGKERGEEEKQACYIKKRKRGRGGDRGLGRRNERIANREDGGGKGRKTY